MPNQTNIPKPEQTKSNVTRQVKKHYLQAIDSTVH